MNRSVDKFDTPSSLTSSAVKDCLILKADLGVHEREGTLCQPTVKELGAFCSLVCLSRATRRSHSYDFRKSSDVIKHSFHWTFLAPQACV